MKIILLDKTFTIVHEFEGVESTEKLIDKILEYRGKYYSYRDNTEGADGCYVYTFGERDVVELIVRIGSKQQSTVKDKRTFGQRQATVPVGRSIKKMKRSGEFR